MSNMYENIARGTKEFPFARYDFKVNQNNLTLTQTHFHNELEIITVKNGEINLLVEGNSIILKKGEIAFINPDEYHAIKTTNGLAQYSAFVFAKELITFPDSHFFQTEFTSKIFSKKNKIPTVLKRDNKLYPYIVKPIEAIRDEYTCVDRKILHLLIEIFTVFVEHNALIKTKNTTNKIPDYVKLCIDYISKNCDQRITLTQLSNLAHISPNHLCYAFKTTTGLTPIEHLQVIRIKKACSLLLKTDYSIEEIALKCGFQNVGYFIKVFKKQTSLTPHAFRKKMAL